MGRPKKENPTKTFYFQSTSTGMVIFITINDEKKVVTFKNHSFHTTDQQVADALIQEHRFGSRFFLANGPAEYENKFRTFRTVAKTRTRVVDLSKEKATKGKRFGRGGISSLGGGKRATGVTEETGDDSQISKVGKTQPGVA